MAKGMNLHYDDFSCLRTFHCNTLTKLSKFFQHFCRATHVQYVQGSIIKFYRVNSLQALLHVHVFIFTSTLSKNTMLLYVAQGYMKVC